jgi:hypothetical protein
MPLNATAIARLNTLNAHHTPPQARPTVTSLRVTFSHITNQTAPAFSATGEYSQPLASQGRRELVVCVM